MKFPIKFLLLLLAFQLALVCNGFAGDYNTSSENLSGSSANPESGNVTASGTVIADPLHIWPPTGFVPEVNLGTIHPGETVNFTPMDLANSGAFTVMGQHTYAVQIVGDIETEKDGLSIVPEWYIGENLSFLGIMPGVSGSFSSFYTIPSYGGFMIFFTIKSMTAAPGAKIGKRVFNFTITCTYNDI